MKTKHVLVGTGTTLLMGVVACLSRIGLQFYSDVQHAELVEPTVFTTQSVGGGGELRVCTLDSLSEKVAKRYKRRLKKLSTFSPEKLLRVQQRLKKLQQKYPTGSASRCFLEILISHIQDLLDEHNGLPVCGNGIVEDGEACDDGNTINDDGCSNMCAVNTAIVQIDDVLRNYHWKDLEVFEVQHNVQTSFTDGPVENMVLTFTVPEDLCVSPGYVGYHAEVSFDNRTTWQRVWDAYPGSTKYNPDCSVTDVRNLATAAMNSQPSASYFNTIAVFSTENTALTEACVTYLLSADNAQYVEHEKCSPVFYHEEHCGDNQANLCFIDLENNHLSCPELGGALEIISGPTDEKIVLKIDMDITPWSFDAGEFLQSLQFDVIYPDAPTDWSLNIGDSATNNGYGGDAGTQHYDAEMQIKENIFSVYGNDFTPSSGTIDGHRLLIQKDDFVQGNGTISLCVENELIARYTSTDNGSYISPSLYGLAGQDDPSGAENKVIYASFNRTISDSGRDGSGAGYIRIFGSVDGQHSDPICGDGIVESGEACDDGNNTNGDGCSAYCQLEYCGDGLVDTDGPDNIPNTPDDEECDDANTTNGDGCSDHCTNESPIDPVCGNAILELGEQCDDGNNTDGDGCSAYCQLENIGELIVEFDHTNTQTDDDMFVIGGVLSDFVAAFNLTAVHEAIEIHDMFLAVQGNITDFVAAVSKVHVFDIEGNLIDSFFVGPEVVAQGGVILNDIDTSIIVSTEEQTILYIALEAKSMGKNKNAGVYGTNDFRFSLDVTTAEGATSHADVTATGVGISRDVAVKPVLVSDLSLTDYNAAKLTSPTQKIGTLKITADTWTNSKEYTISDAELGLYELAVGCAGDFTNFNLRSASQSSSVIPSTCTAGILTFDLNMLPISDKILTPGEVATFYIELNETTIGGADKSVVLFMDESNDSYLHYREYSATCTATDANSCVFDSLRLGVSDFGTADADNF